MRRECRRRKREKLGSLGSPNPLKQAHTQNSPETGCRAPKTNMSNELAHGWRFFCARPLVKREEKPRSRVVQSIRKKGLISTFPHIHDGRGFYECVCTRVLVSPEHTQTPDRTLAKDSTHFDGSKCSKDALS